MSAKLSELVYKPYLPEEDRRFVSNEKCNNWSKAQIAPSLLQCFVKGPFFASAEKCHGTVQCQAKVQSCAEKTQRPKKKLP